jgi:hypothetical protein
MIVGEDGHVAGSVNRAQLAELLAGTDDEELKVHYRELLGESEEGQAASAPAEPEPEAEAAPEVEPEPEPESEPERPADYAAKSDWVAWAVYKGAEEADASAATKAELIELYGGEA